MMHRNFYYLDDERSQVNMPSFLMNRFLNLRNTLPFRRKKRAFKCKNCNYICLHIIVFFFTYYNVLHYNCALLKERVGGQWIGVTLHKIAIKNLRYISGSISFHIPYFIDSDSFVPIFWLCVLTLMESHNHYEADSSFDVIVIDCDLITWS